MKLKSFLMDKLGCKWGFHTWEHRNTFYYPHYPVLRYDYEYICKSCGKSHMVKKRAY